MREIAVLPFYLHGLIRSYQYRKLWFIYDYNLYITVLCSDCSHIVQLQYNKNLYRCSCHKKFLHHVQHSATLSYVQYCIKSMCVCIYAPESWDFAPLTTHYVWPCVTWVSSIVIIYLCSKVQPELTSLFGSIVICFIFLNVDPVVRVRISKNSSRVGSGWLGPFLNWCELWHIAWL